MSEIQRIVEPSGDGRCPNLTEEGSNGCESGECLHGHERCRPCSYRSGPLYNGEYLPFCRVPCRSGRKTGRIVPPRCSRNIALSNRRKDRPPEPYWSACYLQKVASQ